MRRRVWATGPDDQPVHIDQLDPIKDKGLDCGCKCEDCGKQLIAYLNGSKEPHFGHQRDSTCTSKGEKSVHLMAKQIICEAKQLKIPVTDDFHQIVTFDYVEAEYAVHGKRIDVFATQGRNRYFIEIWCEHKTEDDKIRHLKQYGIRLLEIRIDPKLYDADFETLRRHVLFDPGNREWLEVDQEFKDVEQLDCQGTSLPSPQPISWKWIVGIGVAAIAAPMVCRWLTKPSSIRSYNRQSWLQFL